MLGKGTDGKHLDDYLPSYTHKWLKSHIFILDQAELFNMRWILVTIHSNLSPRALSSMIEKWRRLGNEVSSEQLQGKTYEK